MVPEVPDDEPFPDVLDSPELPDELAVDVASHADAERPKPSAVTVKKASEAAARIDKTIAWTIVPVEVTYPLCSS